MFTLFFQFFKWPEKPAISCCKRLAVSQLCEQRATKCHGKQASPFEINGVVFSSGLCCLQNVSTYGVLAGEEERGFRGAAASVTQVTKIEHWLVI